MLAKELHSHLDKMDEVESGLRDDIDKLIAQIDIDTVIKDPHAALAEVVEEIRSLIIDKYAPLAARNGFDLSRLLERFMGTDKDIVVDPSKDPAKNEGILDVRT
jgi:hypothetical protein